MTSWPGKYINQVFIVEVSLVLQFLFPWRLDTQTCFSLIQHYFRVCVWCHWKQKSLLYSLSGRMAECQLKFCLKNPQNRDHCWVQLSLIFIWITLGFPAVSPTKGSHLHCFATQSSWWDVFRGNVMSVIESSPNISWSFLGPCYTPSTKFQRIQVRGSNKQKTALKTWPPLWT